MLGQDNAHRGEVVQYTAVVDETAAAEWKKLATPRLLEVLQTLNEVFDRVCGTDEFPVLREEV
uniref:Uncharacterized protein n=1 Tax=Schlesneria paludicola TaxID=360056 RepID=A0A7C4QNW8_9PLAN